MLKRTVILAAALLVLAGCDTIRSAIGLERHVPDETKVVAHPPLTLPPDYSLRPPGTATAVSGEHETGISAGQNGSPPKEKPGFFGRMFSGEMFGLGSDDDTKAPSPAPAASPGPSVDGTPVAPAPTPPADQAAAPPAQDTDSAAPPAPPPPEKPGFFGRMWHGVFG